MAKEKNYIKKWMHSIALCAILIAVAIGFGCRRANADEFQGIPLSSLEKVSYSAELPSIEKQYEGFFVNFNPENKTPNYVVWTLYGDETTGASSRSNKF